MVVARRFRVIPAGPFGPLGGKDHDDIVPRTDRVDIVASHRS